MIKDLSDRIGSLLSNLDDPCVWGPSGLSYNVDGSLIEGNVPLMASLSKLDFAKELKIAFKQLQLVLLQQERQAHILKAGET